MLFSYFRSHRGLFRFLTTLLLSSVLLSTANLSQPVTYVQAQRRMTDQQVIALGEKKCASPPRAFNPLTASNQDILYYGLPPRPEGDTVRLQSWQKVVKAAIHRDCQFTIVHHALSNVSVASRPALIQPQSTETPYTTEIWSGYVATINPNTTLDFMEANWGVQCINTSSPSGSQDATWVGFGGLSYPGHNAGLLWQAGTEIETGPPASGSPNAPKYHMWTELYPGEDWQVDTQNLSCSDAIYSSVSYTIATQTASAYVADLTNGDYLSRTRFLGVPRPNTHEADWIDERPSCPFTTAPHKLTDFRYTGFSNALVHIVGNRGYSTISAINHLKISMAHNNITLAYPYPLNSDGQSFRDQFSGNGYYGDGYCGS